jgi:hypothetical protein
MTAVGIDICFVAFPTVEIDQTNVDYRQLGIGYPNSAR